MKWIAYIQVPSDAINPPPDLAERLAAPHVRELSDSFDATGGEPMQCPSVQGDGDGRYDIVAGRDRYAAHVLRGAADIWVRVGRFTELERARAEVIENLRRREDARAPLLARLVALTEQDAVTRQVSPKSGKAAHRPTSPRGEARRQVAKDTGLSVAAVTRADQREKAREGAAAQATPVDGSTPAPLPPPIETWGAPFDDSMAGLVQPVLEAIDAADKHLRAAQGALKALGETAVDKGVQARLYDEVHRLAANVRASRPAAICPWCKWETEVGSGYVTDCLGCRSFGWVTAEVMNAAPPELQAPGVYAVAGLFCNLVAAKEQWAKLPKTRNGEAPGNTRSSGLGSEPPPRGTKRRGMAVVMPDGSVFDPYAQAPPPVTDEDLPEDDEAF